LRVSEKKLLKSGRAYFDKADYRKALLNYSEVLQKDPTNREAKLLVVLTDMVMNKENGAEALYDYYLILKDENSVNAEDIIEGLLESIDNQKLEFDKLTDPLQEHLLYADGISYSEFKDVAVREKGFKKAFEDVMFSTKVIITNRTDLIDFLNNLVKNHFYGIALNYLEGALTTFPNDKSLQFLFDKLNRNVEKQK
jgi:tetratricopeptide (TPR) repeat protein